MPHFLIRFNIHSSTHDLDLQILCDKIQTFYKIKNEVDKSQLYFQFFKIKSVSFISLQKHIEKKQFKHVYLNFTESQALFSCKH